LIALMTADSVSLLLELSVPPAPAAPPARQPCR
jgi:hypothetical protein